MSLSQHSVVLLLTPDAQEGYRIRQEFQHELDVLVATNPAQADRRASSLTHTKNSATTES